MMNVKQLGNIMPSKWGEQTNQGRVYDADGLCPTLNSMQGGGRQPHIIEVDIAAMRGRGENNEQQLEINKDGICNTLTSASKDNLVLIRQATKEGVVPCEVGGVADLNYVSSKTRRGRVIENGKICPTLTTENIPNVIEEWTWEIDGVKYLIRIRKLSPIECWRLMAFTDEDFHKAKYKKEILYLEGGRELCNAKLKVVQEKHRLKDTETFVLCTTNEWHTTEVLRTEMKNASKLQESENQVSVSIATERLERPEHLGCATNIIRCIETTGMHFTLTEGKDPSHTDIIAKVKRGNTNTEKCMRITMESNLIETKLYTILTLFAQIIELKIFTSSTVQVNIKGVIRLIEDSEKNILMQLSNLEMEHITERMSNTSLYKQAGNSIVVSVLEGIFRNLL